MVLCTDIDVDPGQVIARASEGQELDNLKNEKLLTLILKVYSNIYFKFSRNKQDPTVGVAVVNLNN
jgi:hypothetical protein